MTMNEQYETVSLKRQVNIESAIDKSSFQMPVFVAISAEGGEAQVGKTFATAREVFDHVFSIVLDRLRQRRAVEAVEGLVPQSAQLTTSRDTEYVLLVRGKAVFWFSGAAAKRAAGRRLLLEHARDLAAAEQAPFYVLNSRAKKVRAAVVATGLLILIAAGFFVQSFVVDWTRRVSRHPTASTPHPGGFVDAGTDAQSASFGADIDAGGDRTHRSVKRPPTGQTASRMGPPASVFDPVPVEPEGRTIVSRYEKAMASFARAWPDRFDDRLVFASSYFDAQTQAPAPVSDRLDSAQPPPSPMVAETRARVPNPGITHRAPVPETSKP
jgi:hypothetical protein